MEKVNFIRTARIISVIVLLILFTSLLTGCVKKDDANNDEAVGDVEEFSFTALDGSTKSLSDYRGKVVVLDMWAAWCSPCQYQMLELLKTYDFYDHDDLEIISVNTDTREDAALIQSFIGEYAKQGYDLSWVFGRDAGSISEKYMKEGALPTIVIFDQEGRLHFRKAGMCFFSEIPEGAPADSTLLAPIIAELL